MRNMFAYYHYDKDYLAHHGIKGQKWGVRRFQNPDGTRTEEGKKRYSSGSSESGSSVGSWAKAHKKELAIAGGVALAAAAIYGSYKLNEVAVESLRKTDLKTANEWLQKSTLLTDKVDEDFHSSIRLRTVMRDGQNMGDIYGEKTRQNMAEARKALDRYHYYTDRAGSHVYSSKERLEELKRLIKD